MSSSPRLATHPGNAGLPATSREAMSENTHPTQPVSSIPAQRAAKSAEQAAPPSEHPQQDKPQAIGTKPAATPPALKPIRPPLNVDVERRGLDPFVIGVIVGASAALIGLLVGLYVLVLN